MFSEKNFPKGSEIKKEDEQIVDLSFIDKLKELRPESGEMQESTKKGEGEKIVLEMTTIINGDDIDKRAALYRQLKGLNGYKVGVLSMLIEQQSIEERTKDILRQLLAI